jgi:uncharacterized protein YggE
MRKLSQLIFLTLGVLSLCSLNGCTAALAQDQPSGDMRRTISVTGTGSVRVKPDIATAVVGATKSAAKLPEAKSASDATLAQIRAALKKIGVADDEIQTVQYQIYRVQANPQGGIRESAWKVVHMIQVRTKKPDSIAGIVDTAVAAGATDVSQINFSVDSLAKYRAKARELAVAAAMEKAQQLAALTHVGIGRVISVSEQGDGYYPMAQMASNMSMDYAGRADVGSGISGGQVEVGTSAAVVFEIR